MESEGFFNLKPSYMYDEIVVNSKDFPDLKVDDIVEIFHPEDENSRLLLQVKSLTQKEDNLQKDIVSIAQSIATSPHFQLRHYKDVCVNVVNSRDVALDLVELTYKEQYFSRSDMCRFKQSLESSCLYLGKKIKFAEMRAQAEELWSKGEKVTCGCVTANTHVVYRSSTAQVNIFIQMSSEMWEFDNYGDLYFEKAVDGFLVDLFTLWKKKNCNHDVTITMFSRTFYEAESMDDFPIHMRDCIQQDHLGRFYEDFYRVVVQNERYDDWTSTLIQLKKMFSEYPSRVLRYHQRPHLNIPRSWNSTAAQGNFIEVLNMSLNVFEKYFLDRCFDRTGKLSIVITPGAGLYEVDRELTNITKQRTIDCGSSSDLVCMGEQPLHVVPLFKFHNSKPSYGQDVVDDYNIPHWISHSFYTSCRQAQKQQSCGFVPRIRRPTLAKNYLEEENINPLYKTEEKKHKPTTSLPTDDVPFVNYDEYDAQIFKLPGNKPQRRKKSRESHTRKNYDLNSSHVKQTKRIWRVSYTAHMENLLSRDKKNNSCSKPIDIQKASRQREFMCSSFGGIDLHDSEDIYNRPVIGSAGTPVSHQNHHSASHHLPRRALINPFAPSQLHFKVTSNRRRWAHAFPTDLQGASVQPHHQTNVGGGPLESGQVEGSSLSNKEISQTNKIEKKKKTRVRMLSEGSENGESLVSGTKPATVYSSSTGNDNEPFTCGSQSQRSYGSNLSDSSASFSSVTNTTEGRSKSASWSMYSHSPSSRADFMPRVASHNDEPHTWLWGMTGEQEWTPEIKTGMDWKGLAKPVSLPITTDYLPDRLSLQMDYLVASYTLLPEECNSDLATRSKYSDRMPLTTHEVYKEMISLRIAQGFQIVTANRSVGISNSSAMSSAKFPAATGLLRPRHQTELMEVILSIGRIFHKITQAGTEISVMKLTPKYPYATKNYLYTYRFQVPDSENYDVSWTVFTNEKPENYNWNYADNYLCTQGLEDFSLMESLKYWRAEFLLIPNNNSGTRKISEGSERCDVYEERSLEDQMMLVDGFLRLLETLNKIRRPAHSRMGKDFTRRPSVTHPPASYGTADTPGRRGSKMADVQELTHIGSFHATSMEHRRVGSGEHLMGTSVQSASMLTGVTKNADVNPVDRGNNEKVNVSSPLTDIIEAMMDPNEGLSFLNKQRHVPPQSSSCPLPSHCFVSAEAATWVQRNVAGVHSLMQSLQLLQRLVDETLICHASNSRNKPFMYGFYLYYVTKADIPDKKECTVGAQFCQLYNDCFTRCWCEVAVHLNKFEPTATVPSFLQPELSRNTVHTSASQLKEAISDLQAKKWVNVDVDPSHKSDREEWAIARYHGNYNTSGAFELEVQWLVATGCIMGELIMSWSRKATANGFHFLPVPGDPFALPFISNSDPLRGPIFVPLNLDSLLVPGQTSIFQDFPASTREQRLFLLQDVILRRFGFMHDRCMLEKESIFAIVDLSKELPRYVHCTGGMFAMIQDSRSPCSVMEPGSYPKKSTKASHKDYIAQQHGGPQSPIHQGTGGFGQVGFLWAWNFMLTKRWRSTNTGDEHFQDKVFADFRSFCANKDQRLEDFWRTSQQNVKDLQGEQHPNSEDTTDILPDSMD